MILQIELEKLPIFSFFSDPKFSRFFSKLETKDRESFDFIHETIHFFQNTTQLE